jgi:hypothetical protein
MFQTMPSMPVPALVMPAVSVCIYVAPMDLAVRCSLAAAIQTRMKRGRNDFVARRLNQFEAA